MKTKLIIFALLIAGCCTPASAQARKGLRINEVMVVNDNSVVDDYEQHSAWIELFNSNYAPLEISSVYLTTDPAKPKMYPVPLGDVNTKIEKRQHVIFWADDAAPKGTFHTNFVLVPDKPNWIGIYDANGVTSIDSITVPVLEVNTSYARKVDGVGDSHADWEVRTGENGLYVTPSSNNIIKDGNVKVDKFHTMDSMGMGLTITAMGIVFTALLLLCICFYIINKIGASRLRKKKMVAHGIDPVSTKRADRPEGDTGEVIAAIVMAMNQHLNAHDLESKIITINKVRKPYSPWNSHIYGLRQLPRH